MCSRRFPIRGRPRSPASRPWTSTSAKKALPLAVAEKELANAGIEFKSAWRVGEITAVIESHAREHGIDLVITGSHGHGALANLAMGSAATKLIASLTVPVLVITREAALRANREQGQARREGAKKREAVAGDD